MDLQTILGSIARHALTTLAGWLVANGFLANSDEQKFVGAAAALLALAWSWWQKKGQAAARTGMMNIIKDFQRKTGKAAPMLLFTVLALGAFDHARAADLTDANGNPVAPAVAQAACLPTDCSGFYVGGNLMGVATNANIIGNGINGSVAAGGQSLGVQAGYQFANGTWFWSAEVMGDYTVNGGPVAMGAGVNRWFFAEGVKVGTSLATLMGIAPTTNPVSIPAKLQAALISPYIWSGAVQRPWGTGWSTGAGAEFALAQNWFLDVRYMYVNYGNANVNASQTTNSENLGLVSINYKF